MYVLQHIWYKIVYNNRYLLRSWGVEFDEDDDEIYILYKKIIREVFFKMCEDMKVC